MNCVPTARRPRPGATWSPTSPTARRRTPTVRRTGRRRPARRSMRPAGRYAVLHVEASTPLKHWEDAKWLALAERLARTRYPADMERGPGGRRDCCSASIPPARFPALGHRLDLAQLWHLVAGAALLVCPDTSVMHIGRLTGTPTVALFGPSSAQLFGPGEFWRDVPYRAVTIADFPCRDQHRLFKREIAWIRRCQRTLAECPAPRCMHAIGVDAVAQAAARPAAMSESTAEFPQRLCRAARRLRGARPRGDREPVGAGAPRRSRARRCASRISSTARESVRRTLGLKRRLARARVPFVALNRDAPFNRGVHPARLAVLRMAQALRRLCLAFDAGGRALFARARCTARTRRANRSTA